MEVQWVLKVTVPSSTFDEYVLYGEKTCKYYIKVNFIVIILMPWVKVRIGENAYAKLFLISIPVCPKFKKCFKIGLYLKC